jgi:hypothetical protein
MQTSDRPAAPPPGNTKTLVRAAAAILFSAILGVSGAAVAAPHGGGGHGGGFHGGGFHGGGFHGGGFHGGGFHGGGFHAGRFHGGGFHGGGFHGGGFYGGFYPGFGLGLALGSAYPWGWGYSAPYDGYYGSAVPYSAAQTWYYCSNPAGYYPYVTQCYGPWQPVAG